MKPLTITVGASSRAVEAIKDHKLRDGSASCLFQMIDLLFDYRSHHRTNFTSKIQMNGSVDLIFEPVARNFNFSFPNVTISVPFGSTSCVITHTIPDHVQFVDSFESISFMSTQVSISMLIVTIIGCWFIMSSRFNRLLDYGKTIWLVIQLLFNQINDLQSSTRKKMKNYKSIIFWSLIVSVCFIKIYFGVHFSAQLTVAQPFPTINSLEQIPTWNISKWVQIFTICPSLLAGSSAFHVYDSKKEWSGSTFTHMGQAEHGKVISLLASEKISALRNKLCAYYPDKRLHVSPQFGQTTISFAIYLYMERRKKKFISNYLRTIMEMGLDKVMLKCDIERKDNDNIGDWNCANQADGNFQEAQPIPLLFYKRHLYSMAFTYFILFLVPLLSYLSSESN